MKITFQKTDGNPSLGIDFFWMMKLSTEAHVPITDHFIPELYFDYFFIQEGVIQSVDIQGNVLLLPQQALKTLHTRSLLFNYLTPLTLFGARLSLKFAEDFWEKDISSNRFIPQCWVEDNVENLSGFADQVTAVIQKHRNSKMIASMLSQNLEESVWLSYFSMRHKRRLYKSVFGLSRKEMQAIQIVHTFLEQTCDFGAENPRIIHHVSPEVFYDQSHLNHAFKKMTGFSPLEYFEANSILQDNLMAASYNEIHDYQDKI